MAFNPNGGLSHAHRASARFFPDEWIHDAPGYYFEPVAGNVFLHEPCADDLKQSTLSDCFLIAALLAIVDAVDEHGISRSSQFINNPNRDIYCR